MKYNFASPTETGKAYAYLSKLIENKGIAEIKKVSPKRSLNQNSYLHLLLSAFGVHFGYTLEESKLVYKQLNKEIYFYTKEVRGKSWDFMRSSADLSKEEMTKSIETLRKWSAVADYPLPTALDQEWIRQLENESEQHERYL